MRSLVSVVRARLVRLTGRHTSGRRRKGNSRAADWTVAHWFGVLLGCVLCAVGVTVDAKATITQVFDPSALAGGPFTVEDFEDDSFEPGITYSASSGIRRINASGISEGVTPSGSWGLSTNSFPNPISLTFDLATPASSVGLWFGNDDTCCSEGFVANLDVFDAGGLIGTISVEANMNDFADQFLGFNSDERVMSVTLRYGSGSDVGLFHYIDDVYFNVAPEPCYAIDAIDDEFSVINDGTSTDFTVLENDECDSDAPISVGVLPGDLQPDRGGLASTNGETVSYTPAAGFAGYEEFTYTAQDAGLQGGDVPPVVDRDTAVITVEVLEDLIPDAVDDADAILQGETVIVDVLENDSLGNAPNRVEIQTQPANGSASVEPDDTIRYTPNVDFFGEDDFEYRLTDANGDSDVATVAVGVFFVRGEVPIDIMPSDPGNNLNLRAGKGATIGVAILSVTGFDAPALIDSSTLKFGPGKTSISGSPRVQDVDGDGDDDLVVKFPTGDSGIACGDTHASLSGGTFDFQLITGTDVINTFNCPRIRKRH